MLDESLNSGGSVSENQDCEHQSRCRRQQHVPEYSSVLLAVEEAESSRVVSIAPEKRHWTYHLPEKYIFIYY